MGGFCAWWCSKRLVWWDDDLKVKGRVEYWIFFFFTSVNSAQITPRTLSFVKKLVSTFGIGFESASNVSQTFSSAASESLARRAQVTAQDPVFQKLKGQFSADFDFRLVASCIVFAVRLVKIYDFSGNRTCDFRWIEVN